DMQEVNLIPNGGELLDFGKDGFGFFGSVQGHQDDSVHDRASTPIESKGHAIRLPQGNSTSDRGNFRFSMDSSRSGLTVALQLRTSRNDGRSPLEGTVPPPKRRRPESRRRRSSRM